MNQRLLKIFWSCGIGCSDDNGNFFFFFLKIAGAEEVVTAYKKQCDKFLA